MPFLIRRVRDLFESEKKILKFRGKGLTIRRKRQFMRFLHGALKKFGIMGKEWD